jgi:glucose-1-phosphate cytidylyltransferase
MDVVILCGGLGSRLGDETILKPKPMVKIGDKPILWHIMKYYSSYGYNKFILPLGYKAQTIINYFKSEESDFFDTEEYSKWEVILEDTGLSTLKGGRLKRIQKHVKTEIFHLTYGDGVCNVSIDKLVKFYNKNKRIGTLTAVHPPSRFGEIKILDDQVICFNEKSQMGEGYINGGYFIFNQDIFNYLTEDESCDFEFGPIQKLVDENNLMAFKHESFWQCMDNIREKNHLNYLLENKLAPWVIW